MTSPDDLADVRERVRARYAAAAAAVLTGGTPSCGEPCSGEAEAGTGAGHRRSPVIRRVPRGAGTGWFHRSVSPLAGPLQSTRDDRSYAGGLARWADGGSG